MEASARHERADFLQNYSLFVEKIEQTVSKMKAETWNCDDYAAKGEFKVTFLF